MRQISDRTEDLIEQISLVSDSGQDSTTDAQVTIDYAHHEIHSGSHYFISGYAALNNAGTKIFSVTTPNTTKWAHMLFYVQALSTLTIEVYEGATVSAGNLVTPLNNDRNSSKVSVMVVREAPTISAAGTLISSSKFGAAGAANRSAVSGSVGRESEIILRQNTSYVWKFISGADNNILSYDGEWYEHTNK